SSSPAWGGREAGCWARSALAGTTVVGEHDGQQSATAVGGPSGGLPHARAPRPPPLPPSLASPTHAPLPHRGPAMDTDRNLLFGVLALQADLLDNDRFAEACSAWAVRKGTPLADLLVERGWLTPDARALIHVLLECLLKRHGDARASLAAVAGPEVRRA